MRKVLLGSTALVAAGMLAGSGAPAQGAEPITLSVGGYYYAFFVLRAQSDVDNDGVGTGQLVVGNDEDIRHTDVSLEGEIFFTGSTTLDNGITVGVNVQLEGYTTGDQIDEHFVFFSGNFGRLVIGAENSASLLMHYGPPGAFIYHGVDSPGMWGLVGTSGNATGTGSPVATPPSFVSDANKITYFTPRFSPGFQFGFSYTPDTTDEGGGGGSPIRNATDSDDRGQENVISFGVNFVRAFDDVDFAWSFGWEHGFVEGNGEVDLDDQQGQDILATGFQVGVDGWKVGGAFGYNDEGQERDEAEYEFSGGVSYGAGPWAVSVQGAFGLDKDGVTVINNVEFDNDSDKVLAGEIGGAYTLGPGVKIAAGVQGWRGWGDDGNENFDGVAFSIGTGLSF